MPGDCYYHNLETSGAVFLVCVILLIAVVLTCIFGLNVCQCQQVGGSVSFIR